MILPWGEETKFDIKLDFRASNNEVEYYALLLRLKVAKTMEIPELFSIQIEHTHDLNQDQEAFTELVI